LDIQIQIWIGALTYSLTSMTISCKFGYPNSKMDSALTDLLTDTAISFTFGHPNSKIESLTGFEDFFIFGHPKKWINVLTD
jgi:hypothetical protein